MVNYIIGILVLLGGMLEALPTNNVSASVQWDSIYENTPFTVTVQVTHDAQDKIDNDSFQVDGKKIAPKFIEMVKISPSSPLEVATYEFEMPGLARGLQTLPVISVLIGRTKVSSIPSGFQVKSKNPNVSAAAPPKGAFVPAAKDPSIQLQTVFTATPPVYPGQIFYLGYRYLFNVSIDLSEEKLPFFDSKQLKKIGDKRVEEGEEGGFSVSQIVQKFQALEPGTIIFPPSKIAGYAYALDQTGKKYYKEPKLSAEIASLKLEIAPFPEKDKPASFNGNIGDYTFSAKLMGDSRTMHPGEKIQILLTVRGKGDLDQVKVPELCCQPGFSGNFKSSDLPPVVTMNQEEKNFLVDLIVQNDHVSSVPPIEFSFFNPETRSYGTVKSQDISLNIASLQAPTAPSAYSPPDVAMIPPKEESPVPFSFEVFLAMGMVVAAGLVLLLFVLQYSSAKKPVETKEMLPLSRQMLVDASSHLENASEFYSLTAKALRQTLLEQGVISNLQEPLEKIPETDATIPYKDLLVKIEQERFADQGTLVPSHVLKEADRLIAE